MYLSVRQPVKECFCLRTNKYAKIILKSIAILIVFEGTKNIFLRRNR
jgi:hypothetical protein